MDNYIKEYCVLPPLEKPLYDKDSDTWDIWFELRKNEQFPYEEDEILPIPFDTKEEADEVFDWAFSFDELEGAQVTAS